MTTTAVGKQPIVCRCYNLFTLFTLFTCKCPEITPDNMALNIVSSYVEFIFCQFHHILKSRFDLFSADNCNLDVSDVPSTPTDLPSTTTTTTTTMTQPPETTTSTTTTMTTTQLPDADDSYTHDNNNCSSNASPNNGIGGQLLDTTAPSTTHAPLTTSQMDSSTSQLPIQASSSNAVPGVNVSWCHARVDWSGASNSTLAPSHRLGKRRRTELQEDSPIRLKICAITVLLNTSLETLYIPILIYNF